MTDEQEALAMVNELSPCRFENLSDASHASLMKALRHAVQERKAFAQEVSDAVEQVQGWPGQQIHSLSRFIIAKPDPLVEAFRELGWKTESPRGFRPDRLRAALAKHNGRIIFDD